MLLTQYCVVLVLLAITACEGLKLVHFRVPPHQLLAGTAVLHCIFDLQNSTLYSVKWYKDGEEFYRFTPEDSPPGQAFPLPGVTVDLEDSGEKRVMLRLITHESSGTYRCEVSTEAPRFLTVSAEAYMLAMVLPRDSPHITGLFKEYAEGDPLEINCTSARSRPATSLTWFVNDKEVTQVPASTKFGPWRTQYRTVQGDDNLEQVTLGLRMAVNRALLPKRTNTKLTLRCTATLGSLQWHVHESTMVKLVSSASDRSSGLLFWILMFINVSYHC